MVTPPTFWRHPVLTRLFFAGLLLSVAACANTPDAAPRASTQAPQTTPAAGAAANPSALRQEMVRMNIDTMLSRVEFFEETSKMPRTATNFAPMRKAITAIYTDDVVIDWLVARVEAGLSTEQLTNAISRSLMNGIARLDDAQAMAWLQPIGNMMGRLDGPLCDELGRAKGSAGFARLATHMTADEVLAFFGGMHQGLVAEIQNKPVRPVPRNEDTRAAMAQMEAAALLKPGAKATTVCATFSRALTGLQRMQGPTRSAGVTYVLTMVGVGAKQALTQRQTK